MVCVYLFCFTVIIFVTIAHRLKHLLQRTYESNSKVPPSAKPVLNAIYQRTKKPVFPEHDILGIQAFILKIILNVSVD